MLVIHNHENNITHQLVQQLVEICIQQIMRSTYKPASKLQTIRLDFRQQQLLNHVVGLIEIHHQDHQ